MELVSLRMMCEKLNVSRRTIQRYEDAGLLAPSGKNKYGYLLYDSAAVERAGKIKFLNRLGFPIREIGAVLDAPDDVLKQALCTKVKEMEKERETMNALIDEAYRMIDSLG